MFEWCCFANCSLSDTNNYDVVPEKEGLPFNSVGGYRVRSVDLKSDVLIQKLILHPPAKLWKNNLEFETLDLNL
jgi:hypothetical protein